MQLFVFLYFLFSLTKIVFASAGDKSKFYNDCVYDCKKDICDKGLHNPLLKAYVGLNISLWSCIEDCDYDCQWRTVGAFLERKWEIPKFHGKWPFLRLFGLQEPASAIFSICNFLVILSEWSRFQKYVPSDSPYYKLWKSYTIVSLNCWIWSTVYHARDTEFTEKLDYISASILVFMAFYVMTVRAFQLQKTTKSIMWTIVCACVLLNHCAYLWFYSFDYSYNMLFNVIVGSLAVSGWLIWAAVALKMGHPSSRSVALYGVLMAVASLLEMMDFPPILWAFDAHALWHMSTCFIIQIFYSFLREDSLYLRKLARHRLPTKTE